MELTENDVKTILEGKQGSPDAPTTTSPTPATPPEGGANPPPVTPPAPAPQGGVPAEPAKPGDPAKPVETPAFDPKTLGFESVDEIKTFKQKYSQLEQELNEAKGQPKFASEKAKLLYDIANKAEGMEMETLQQYLNVVSKDLKALPDQQLRYEAFKLNPVNKGLSQDEVKTLFMEDEAQKFGDPDNPESHTDVQKIRAKQATAQARSELEKLQSDYNSVSRTEALSPEQEAQQLAEYKAHVQKTLPTFDGIQLKLTAQDEEGKSLESSLNFKVDPEKQLAVVHNFVTDPQGWWANYLAKEGVTEPGKEELKLNAFAKVATRLVFQQELLNSAYHQGRADQLIDKLKVARNGQIPGEGGTPPVGGGPPKSEAEQAIEGALKVVGIQ